MNGGGDKMEGVTDKVSANGVKQVRASRGQVAGGPDLRVEDDQGVDKELAVGGRSSMEEERELSARGTRPERRR